MKKFILLFAITLTIFSCSDDDSISPEIEQTTPGLIRVSRVDTQADLVTLTNLGTTTTNIGGYFLCLGPGTYVNVADVATGSTSLSPNQSIELPYDVNEVADGLSVFSTNTFGSSDPTILLDYVQWGAGNQPRVSQAVEAGRWDNAANFLIISGSYNFTGTADQFGSTFYEAIEEESPVVRILQVNSSTDQVWLSNFGDTTVDVGDFWLCLGPGTYVQVSAATTNPTVLEPGENVMLDYDVNEAADGLSIFSTNVFGSSDPTILLDYVQWGEGNQARVDQAVTAGRWDDTANFVANGSPYTFTGTAEQFGSTVWEGTEVEESTAVRIAQVNANTDQVWLGNFGNTTVDVGDYWLCLGPGTYVQVSQATTNSTVLEPGENVMLDYDVNEAADGLSIFSTNVFGSSDPTILLDYVQWGEANQARVGQAVTAGRWDDAANFVANGSPYTFTGTAEQFGSTVWEGTEVEESTVVRIAQVNANTDQVWLGNFGNTTVDVGDYWLCLGPGTYVQVSAATTASTSLEPGENVMLSYNVNETVDGLSIFSTNVFGSSDPTILLDYVQWGEANQARVGQAVTAGRWDDAANFITDGPSYTFNGTADEFGSTFW